MDTLPTPTGTPLMATGLSTRVRSISHLHMIMPPPAFYAPCKDSHGVPITDPDTILELLHTAGLRQGINRASAGVDLPYPNCLSSIGLIDIGGWSPGGLTRSYGPSPVPSILIGDERLLNRNMLVPTDAPRIFAGSRETLRRHFDERWFGKCTGMAGGHLGGWTWDPK
jgi:hypothetical protein